MKIEIIENEQPIKVKKTKLEQPNMIEIDFKSIKGLVGNKIMLESMFQQTKSESLNG